MCVHFVFPKTQFLISLEIWLLSVLFISSSSFFICLSYIFIFGNLTFVCPFYFLFFFFLYLFWSPGCLDVYMWLLPGNFSFHCFSNPWFSCSITHGVETILLFDSRPSNSTQRRFQKARYVSDVMSHVGIGYQVRNAEEGKNEKVKSFFTINRVFHFVTIRTGASSISVCLGKSWVTLISLGWQTGHQIQKKTFEQQFCCGNNSWAWCSALSPLYFSLVLASFVGTRFDLPWQVVLRAK